MPREERVKEWLESFGAKEASQMLSHAALKFFYHDVMGIPLSVFSIRKKRAKRLSAVLSRQEVSEIPGMINNRKHLLMIYLLYGLGLRVSELVGLNIQDANLDTCRLRQGKGGKDRYCVLPRTLTEELSWAMGHRAGAAHCGILSRLTCWRTEQISESSIDSLDMSI